MEENKGTINIQAEKIRRLQKILEYRTLELKGAKSEIDILKFKLEKQKEKNRRAGGLIAGLKHELTKEQTTLVQPIWEEADKEEKKEKVEDKVDSISRAVEALEKKNEEKRREETGDELILKGLIKTLQDVKDSGNQFEINITNEKRTGFLGHTIETGREIATIKYHKPGKGVLNIKKLEGE